MRIQSFGRRAGGVPPRRKNAVPARPTNSLAGGAYPPQIRSRTGRHILDGAREPGTAGPVGEGRASDIKLAQLGAPQSPLGSVGRGAAA